MKLKKLFITLCAVCCALALACGFSACGETENDGDSNTVSVVGVGLNESELQLEVGDTCTLIATVMPENATNKTVTWKSSNTGVATVDGGVVTAISAGNATITATADGKSAECAVTVTAKQEEDKPAKVPVESVTLDKQNLELEVGGTDTLTATVFPNNATDKTVTWKSSNTGVATVEDGVVTAISAGNATITATADGKSAECAVTVTAKQEEDKPAKVPVERVSLDKESLSLEVGGTDTLTATVFPDNATDKDIIWQSSDTGVVTVEGGVVTAISAGNATITATADGKSTECAVTVTAKQEEDKPTKVPVESVSLDKQNLELEVGGTDTLTATVLPENATEKTIMWQSSNEAVATVEDGVVTAISVGEATITATADGKSATCVVAVIDGEEEGGDEPVDPPETSIITYAHAGEESAAFEWTDGNASKAKVEYKLSSSSSYTPVDSQLVRQISSTVVRADILGLKGGAEYDFKITASDSTVEYVRKVTISSLDRSGYAHVGINDGVGAYKNDGTLKSGATVIYLTEANKNNVDGNGNSIAQYLSKASGNSSPIVIRVIGTVGSATWNELIYNDGKPITADAVKGVNGKPLPTNANDLTQSALISGGYNTLNYYPEKFGGVKCDPIDGLNSKATYDSANNEYDSCWNDCSVSNLKNVTVEGVGEDAEIFQWGFTFKSCNSIEVRNIRFYDYTEDACSFEGSENSTTLAGFKHSNFWVHHNIFDIGMNYWDVCNEQDKHEGDGATDFKKLSYVTVAYNRYNYTHKTGLVGGGDTHYQACFTFHHNYYNGCDQRMPLGRQANIHIYNNYFYKSGLYSISLRAGAYAFIENCVFTSNTGSTKPIELVKGSAGTPSAKVIDCQMEGSISNGVGSDYLYQGTDRSKTVKGDNLYGLNFEQASDFYTVTNKLETNKVASTIPTVAGTFKRNNNIKIAGSQEPDPPRTPDDVTMSVFNAIEEGKLRVSVDSNDKQDIENLALTDNITLTAKQTTVTANDQSFDDGQSFTHRVILGKISSSNQRYFKITLKNTATIKVYVANKGDGTRNIGLYTDKDNTDTTLVGTKMGLDKGDAEILVNSVSAGVYYLVSTDGDLSIYAIDIVDGGTQEDPPATGEGQSVSYSQGNAGDTVSGTFADGELFTATSGQNTTVTKNVSTATADDGSGRKFDYAILPGSGSGQTITVVAKKAITLTIYYSASDSKFSTDIQSKGGNLTWTVDGGTAVNSAKTGNKDNDVAYSETITLEAGQTVVFSLSSNRLVLYGLFAVEK